MLYCTTVRPTNNATDDTNGTEATVTLNPLAKRVLYVGGYDVDATHTPAEGAHMSAFFSGDIQYGGTISRIPLSPSWHASMVGGDKYIANAARLFYPVDWTSGGSAVLTVNTRGIGGTVASEADIFILYSDGEGHPAAMPIWSGPRGLRGIPRIYVRPDLTAISNSTTETAGNAITRPVNASQCVGLAPLAVTDGTVVAADEMNTRVRFTANGLAPGQPQFEPDQIWPVFGGAYSAGLQGLANASIDSSPFDIDFWPLKFALGQTGTVTPNYTMRSAVTNAVEHYCYGAFV